MAETVLLDTDVVSFILKDNRDFLSPYVPHLINRTLAISFMTVAELFQWAAVRNWGTRRERQLEEVLKNYLLLPFDIQTCKLWASIRAECQSKGRRISAQDAWVAATAIQHDLLLVTNNRDDFDPVSQLRLTH